ncbi:MAG: RNA methyltransferase [Bacillota bacterium]|nr:RNA methyltransferase [Bacillota bacterium]
MSKIQSSSNNLIKTARKLKQRKYRDEQGKYIIEGIHLLQEIIKWTSDLEQVIVTEEFLQQGKDIEESAVLINSFETNKIPMAVVEKKLFLELCETDTPQGIIGIARKQPNDTSGFEMDVPKVILILNNIQDPGNLGTLIRTADAAGITNLILTKGTVDPYNGKVLRSAMGSHFHLKIQVVENEMELIAQLKADKVQIAVAHMGAAVSLYDANLTAYPLALVLGNEANGPTANWLGAADYFIKIPILGKAESLNVSIAGAVILYEIVRQNGLTS